MEIGQKDIVEVKKMEIERIPGTIEIEKQILGM
jgi:hypothetical protein